MWETLEKYGKIWETSEQKKDLSERSEKGSGTLEIKVFCQQYWSDLNFTHGESGHDPAERVNFNREWLGYFHFWLSLGSWCSCLEMFGWWVICSHKNNAADGCYQLVDLLGTYDIMIHLDGITTYTLAECVEYLSELWSENNVGHYYPIIIFITIMIRKSHYTSHYLSSWDFLLRASWLIHQFKRGFLSHRGTSSHHPFIDGDFPFWNQRCGYSHFPSWKPPFSHQKYYKSLYMTIP